RLTPRRSWTRPRRRDTVPVSSRGTLCARADGADPPSAGGPLPGATMRGGRATRPQKGDVMPRSVLKATAIIALLAIPVMGCETVQDNPKATIGGLGGAAVGGLIAAAAGGGGPAIAGAVIGGALLGGLAGNMLDQRDKRLAAEAQQRALESAPT